ncbi:calcium-activated chloride channel regulator 4-like isoform X2 [Homarus americanus]|uniref:calcium-activated chloride channel regulator 4-like isoform X2 n=1 Tax=Homarus americanus TaxID=6706 RepID=UPI001C45BF6A|nr:calcium-activated chloride channel regulator 4-like isoform X2 [Homarus americanus]
MRLNMRVMLTALLLLGLWGRGPGAASKVELINNGYEDVVIGISPEIDESQGQAIITALKKMLIEASGHLFTATRRRAFFRRVKILIPQSWTNTPFNQTATTERFKDSEIQVKHQNFAYGNQPYTEQPEGCEKAGTFIHLTPEYLTTSNYTTGHWDHPGKSLVPLWAKLRWGVFDEFGFPSQTSPEFRFFYEPKTNNNKGETDTTLPNYCANEALKGEERTLKPRLEGEDVEDWCLEDKTSTDDCRFYPSNIQTASTSIMSYPFVKSVSIVEFCDANTHRYDAPNKQNKFCKMSVWDVMLKHSDFRDNQNPIRTTPIDDTQVIVVQEVDPSFAIVMDVSSSMTTNNRYKNLQTRVKAFLLHKLPANSSVSLIKFGSTATVLADLAKVTDENSRKNLVALVDTTPSGGTSIGSGLKKALEVLKNQRNKHIFLITDGEENTSPLINEVWQDMIQANVCIMTVALGKSADDKIEKLATETGGKALTVRDDDQINMLDKALVSTLTRFPAKAAQFTRFEFYDSLKINTEKLEVKDSFIVDKSIGKNLIFHLETDNVDHVDGSPKIRDPDGIETNINDFNSQASMWTISFPMAKIGVWKWSVALTGSSSNWVKAFATSQTRDTATMPIITETWSTNGSVGRSKREIRIRIYCKVTQRENPVLWAAVKGIVTGPDNTPPDIYDLKDTGQTPDTMENDGIYSSYLTKFPSTGRYSLDCEVDSTEDTVVPGQPVSNTRKRRNTREGPLGPSLDLCCGTNMPFDPSTTSPTGAFRRKATGGVIKLTEVPGPGEDILPPDEVMDLQVISITLYTNTQPVTTITLTWSTPGDDLNQGTVSNYIFQLSSNKQDLSDNPSSHNQLDTVLPVTKSSLEDAHILVESGNKVTFDVTCRKKLEFERTYYLGLQTVDDSNNMSEMSNIVPFTVMEKLAMPSWSLDRSRDINRDVIRFKRKKEKVGQ